MRYKPAHRQQTRERILRTAAERFRAGGLETVGVADVMKAAGLTHGGFYKHFTAKDELVGEALQFAFEEVSSQLLASTQGLSRSEALRSVIEFYLSEQHMTHPGNGCAVAALGTELARMDPRVKSVVSRALDAYAARLSPLMPGNTESERRAAFLVLFPAMAGCIMAARSHTDKTTQRQILEGGRSWLTRAFCDSESQHTKGEAQ